MSAPLRSALSSSSQCCRRIASSRPKQHTAIANFASSSRITQDSSTRTTFLDTLDDALSSPSSSSSSSSSTYNPPPPRPRAGFDLPPHQSSGSSSSGIPYLSTPPPSTSPSGPTLTSSSLASQFSAKDRALLFRGRNKTIPKYSPIEPPLIVTDPERGQTTPDRQAVTHILIVQVTRNNTQLSFVDAYGDVFGRITGGTGGVFKKSNRSTYEAAHQAAIKMFEKVLAFSREHQPVQVCVSFKGLFGAGREAVASAIGGPEGAEFRALVVRVEDRTPLKIGGDRPRGKRNV